MLFHAYLRNAIVYVPTVVKLQTGAYMDVDPVAVVPVANTDGLRHALLDAIARKNVIVPPPPKDNWPPPVLLKYAGVKTWSAFARGACGLEHRREGRDIPNRRAIEPIAMDIGRKIPDQKTNFPPDTTVHDVVERMIAILQDAAQNSEPALQRYRSLHPCNKDSLRLTRRSPPVRLGSSTHKRIAEDERDPEDAAGAVRQPAGLSVESAQPRRFAGLCRTGDGLCRRGAGGRAGVSLPARPADLELSLPAHDPAFSGRRRPRGRARFLRLRPLRQAGRRRRLHLRLPPQQPARLRPRARSHRHHAGGAGLGRPARPDAADGDAGTLQPG